MNLYNMMNPIYLVYIWHYP